MKSYRRLAVTASGVILGLLGLSLGACASLTGAGTAFERGDHPGAAGDSAYILARVSPATPDIRSAFLNRAVDAQLEVTATASPPRKVVIGFSGSPYTSALGTTCRHIVYERNVETIACLLQGGELAVIKPLSGTGAP